MWPQRANGRTRRRLSRKRGVPGNSGVDIGAPDCRLTATGGSLKADHADGVSIGVVGADYSTLNPTLQCDDRTSEFARVDGTADWV
jgi:hypothetical protein